MNKKQIDALRVLHTLERANGSGFWGCSDPTYRVLERKGLAVSQLRRGEPTTKGGGSRRRYYKLTAAGHQLLEPKS